MRGRGDQVRKQSISVPQTFPVVPTFLFRSARPISHPLSDRIFLYEDKGLSDIISSVLTATKHNPCYWVLTKAFNFIALPSFISSSVSCVQSSGITIYNFGRQLPKDPRCGIVRLLWTWQSYNSSLSHTLPLSIKNIHTSKPIFHSSKRMSMCHVHGNVVWGWTYCHLLELLFRQSWCKLSVSGMWRTD